MRKLNLAVAEVGDFALQRSSLLASRTEGRFIEVLAHP